MTSGLDDFKLLLKEFRGLSVWAVGGSLVVPFAASLADLSPPWPPGIVPVTAVVELLALVLVFQFFKTARRQIINVVLILSVALFAVTSVVYLSAISYFTYQVPTTKERFVKGYECTPDAQMVFKNRCPDLGLDELRTAEYDAERLWTRKSLAVTRTGLALVWSLVFVALSFALGGFLGYQMRTRKRLKSSPAQST
jgi:ABC-type xylose transport system permease subunit